MNIKKLSLAAAVSALTFTTASNAVLGPIPIYLNTEYRTSNPVVGSIASSLTFNKGDIISSGANTFGEFLAGIPGVEYEGGQGNLTALRIRGNEASHTLLLVDGAKVSITASQANLDVVPLDAIENIEITKGPFSSLYGPGAIGGVIHVTTNKKNIINRDNLKISFGTHNTKKIVFNSNNITDNGYFNISLSDYHTDGINATEQDNTQEKDSIDRRSLSVNTGIKINNNTNIEFNLLNTNADIEYDDLYGGAVKADNNLTQYNIKTTNQINDNLSSSLDVRKQKTQRRGDKYELTGLTLLNEYNLDKSVVSFGLELESDKNIGNSKYIKHNDIFAQYQTNVANNDFVVGYRNVNHDKFSKHHTYNLGWGKDINNSLRINAAFGKATNLPNHYQNNLNITANKTELKPEFSKNLEIGLDYKNISAKIFKSKTENAFSYSYGDDGVWSNDDHYINKDGIENKGVELNLKNRLSNWDINSSFTYLDSIDSTTKLDQGRRPNKSLNITAKNSFGKFDNKVQLIAKSSTFDHDNNTTRGKNAGYGLINLGTVYDYDKKTNVYLNINNAFDKDYTVAKTSATQSYNQLGRTINLGVNYTF